MAQAKHLDVKFFTQPQYQFEVAVGFSAGFVQIYKRCTRQFQLPTWFQRYRITRRACKADDIFSFPYRLPIGLLLQPLQ